METGIKSSFIPQTPIVPVRAERRGGGGYNVLVLAAIVIFVASASLAVGVFLYAQYLSTSAASKLASLERAKQAFEPSLIQELTRLDDRMRAADTILSNHVAPTTLFGLLEQITLQTVSFSSFEFQSAGKESKLTMQGVAQSVNSIALQADLLSKSGMITNPIFSNINREVSGVHFDFAANVNPTALLYTTLENPQAAGGQGVGTQTTPAPQTPASPFGTPGAGGAAKQPQQKI